MNWNEQREQTEREMSWTTWSDSCKDPTLTAGGEARNCRRQRGHEGWHASGFKAGYYTWN